MSDGQTAGHPVKKWTVEVSIGEHEGRMRAVARLRWRERESVGIGLARRRPADADAAEIDDELAAALALSNLADQLLAAADESAAQPQ